MQSNAKEGQWEELEEKKAKNIFSFPFTKYSVQSSILG